MVVVASLSDSTWWSYRLGFPKAGPWREIFNSDWYDHRPNPAVAGNAGALVARPEPLHGLPASAELVIPANGLLVLAAAAWGCPASGGLMSEVALQTG